MEKFICIHGHFYQPPRENAWLEEVEMQESAAPYHDWNERIDSECYAPNANSRVLNEDQEIIDIVNNYSKISFNFGPTLLSWMEKYAPETYKGILQADKKSMKYFDGHGSAMAQVYNHLIMPLANRRDKETQVIWGIEDFKMRFNRHPEGMWLAETAVDTETLEVLTENDIKFTVLAPNQAKRFRKIGDKEWQQGVNTQFHYTCKLPSGKSIILFFYDGALSQRIAFEGLLKDGRQFAQNLVDSFSLFSGDHPLVHVATDGESYGHHHRYGDMALAYCLRYIEENKLANLTNYSQYSSLFDPEYEVEIHENTSWSCAHGVERWRANCGCNTGGHAEWTQEWRSPLRLSLNWLRDQLIKVYEREMPNFNSDIWALRNQYIRVINNRSRQNVDAFIQKHTDRELDAEETTKFIRLLEMQRQALLMFTSCAWFFDEISGIETVQVLQYANRAIQLAERESNVFIEEEFKTQLAQIKSNIPEFDNGAAIYQRFVSPARLTLSSVGMHYAVASLFAEEPEVLDILSYRCSSEFFERWEAGVQRLSIGNITINSKITLSEKRFYFVAIYLGQHHIIGSATDSISEEAFRSMVKKLKTAFNSANLSQVIQIKQHYFPQNNFSIRELFKDEQLKVLHKIMEKNITQAVDAYKDIYRDNYNLLGIMRESNLRMPKMLRNNLEIVLSNELYAYFKNQKQNVRKLKSIVKEFQKWEVTVDKELLKEVASKHMLTHIEQFEVNDFPPKDIEHVLEELRLCLELDMSFWRRRIQNAIFFSAKALSKKYYSDPKIGRKDKIKLSLLNELCYLVGIKSVGLSVLMKV